MTSVDNFRIIVACIYIVGKKCIKLIYIIIIIIKEEIFNLGQIKKLCERTAHAFYVLYIYMQACYIKM